jgi:hypothetical protein
MKSIKFDLFGREVLVAKTEDGWQAFYVGNTDWPEILLFLTI